MGLVNIYLLENFSNYFNRKIKAFRYIQEYLLYQTDNGLRYNNHNGQQINFNPNDGVNTSHVFNINLYADGEEWIPDYLIIVGQESGTIGYTEVESRWFVVECKRTRKGQYEMQLRRDVIADFWLNIKQAPIYVEKACVPIDNPLIFNKEGMNFNQIKTKEYLLKDETGIAWIVGYISRNGKIENATRQLTVLTDYTNTYMNEIGITGLPAYQELSVLQGNQSIELNVRVGVTTQKLRIYLNYLLNEFSYEVSPAEEFGLTTIGATSEEDIPNIANAIGNELINSNTLFDDIKPIIDTKLTHELYNSEVNEFLRQCDGKTWTNGSTYGKFETKFSSGFWGNVSGSTGKFLDLNAYISDAILQLEGTYSINSAALILNYRTVTVDLYIQDFNPGTITFDSPLTRNKLDDAPYDMFVIPYCDKGTMNIYDPVNEEVLGVASKAYALLIAQLIGSYGEGASGIVYDIQLLPYCPINGIVRDNQLIVEGNEGIEFNYVRLQNGEDIDIVQIVYYATRSSGTKNIELFIPSVDPKVENECDMYRLVSPNYQGIYEFNLARNGGLNYINVDYTYKPYSPYIHLNPNFGGLYGRDFNDARGLICGGDFSIAIVSDAWKQYEINNKNYQNIFDREIKSMERMQGFQRVENIAGAIAGTAQGAMLGGVAGGPVGAIAGGVASGLGGIADIAISEGRFKESIQYKTDMFNYQLGNIKALPYSLTKSAAQNYNNKIFPFLEFYTCTDTEREIFKKKIKYNGMTVQSIGTIQDYLTIDYEWFQGQMIRIEDISEDSHVFDAIYDELKKGVYLNGSAISD